MLSEAQISLCQRAAAIECELEQMEGALSRGKKIDLDLFTRSASHLRRLLESVGLQRRAREVAPDLSRYIAAVADGRRPTRPRFVDTRQNWLRSRPTSSIAFLGLLRRLICLSRHQQSSI